MFFPTSCLLLPITRVTRTIWKWKCIWSEQFNQDLWGIIDTLHVEFRCISREMLQNALLYYYAYYKTNRLWGDRELAGFPLGPLGLKRLLMFNRSWCEASAVWVGQIKWVWSKVVVFYVQNSLFVLMSLCWDSALKAFCFVFPTVRGDIFTLLDLSVQQSKTQRCAIYYQRTEKTSKYSHLRSLT